MSLLNRIETDMKEAMKAKNSDVLQTLRMVKAAVLNEAIQKKKNDLTDPEILEVLQKQVKQRKESIESFKAANRPELAAKEERELQILLAYLPKQLSEAEIDALVKAAVSSTQSSTKADIGKVMKELMPKVKGLADGKLVNEVVARYLK